MDPDEQTQWLTTHIPHRVRAATARLDMTRSLLGVRALIDPECRTVTDKVYWRCSTDSIWEGRLAATRWLIEFVGIKEGPEGNPAVAGKSKHGKDVRIDDLEGGELFDHSTDQGRRLASLWKGCSQASGHATKAYDHPSVSDKKELPDGLAIILDHLQRTIYQKAGMNIRDHVLSST